MTREYPFDEFPEKGIDWQQVIKQRDLMVMWLGQWRDKLPSNAVADLQDLLGIPRNE